MGVRCLLFYEDVAIDRRGALEHLRQYGYHDIAAAADGDRAVARRAGATVTPQAVVIDRRGDVRYRGRIDNAYVRFGTRRTHVTVHDLTDAIDAVLANRRVASPETEALGCAIAPHITSRK
jgi:hypothetical protein